MCADGLFGYLPNKAIQSTASHFLRIKVMVVEATSVIYKERIRYGVQYPNHLTAQSFPVLRYIE